MTNLRLSSFTVIDSTHLSAKFNSQLSPLIGIDNIIMASEINGIQDPIITKITVTNNTIEIVTLPLVTQAFYTVTFISTDLVLFKSLNGDAVILNDGVTNKYLFTVPVDTSNPVKDSIIELLKNNVYDLEGPSVISKYIDGLSIVLSKALYNIGQTKNDNYLSFTVTDELKTRGAGAHDRLNQEGAYDIIRVAKTATTANLSETISKDEFPLYPVSLLSTNIAESLTINNSDTVGSFNLKTLTINCSKFPVIILNSVTFIYNSELAPFTYDTTTYGYQVQDSDYDPNYAFTYLLLENNQFKLSDKVLSNSLFSLENIASINIDYQYKNQGKIIDTTSLVFETVLTSSREVIPAIENIFNLKNAPIVKSTNLAGDIGDVSFSDPNVYSDSNSAHPAFIYEIPFRLDYMPSRAGEYSIDYPTGTIYVFGEDKDKAGTGPYPPLATYLYRHTFQSEIDYVYDETTSDIVYLPNGNLGESQASISYNFEEVLIKDVDYKAEVHKEELSERIDNRLSALNTLYPLNFPITNVFRIFNETSGEIYKISRWNDSKVFFTYQTPPRILDITKERATFDSITNETLFVSSTTSLGGGKNLFKIFLENNNIIAASEDAIGHFKNSSLALSETTTFSSEFYYDTELTESQNNSILTTIGDYQINYADGVIWVVVSSSQDLSIGTVSYKRGYIKTQYPHIITTNDLYYKLNSLADKTRALEYISFTDDLILPSTFDRADENFISGITTLPYQIYGGNIGVFESAEFTVGVTDYVKYVRNIFERIDALNNTNPINFATASTFNGKTISVSTIEHKEYQSVQQDGASYVVYTNTDLSYLSSNITINMSVTRLSDSAQLWDGSGTIEEGTPFRVVLSGANSPIVGDSVLIEYSFEIDELSRVIVDYSRGDYLLDYSYLADEIILSYEYGDNLLDFSGSYSVEPGDNYYVTYKVGALRTALLNNFGTLIDIPILNNLNVDFARERYRDALMAAMQSFTQGPTITSLNNIVHGITHVTPEIIESVFRNWGLGSSLLSRQKIEASGSPELLPAKFGNGILISDVGQSVSFPIVSNLKIEEGTMGMWVVPQWNGIDNQAELEVTIIRDGYVLSNQNEYFIRDGYAISDQEIFIGPGEDHPVSIDGFFTVSNVQVGMPNKNKDGIYIYLLPDSSELFNRWYVDIVDGYTDGYVANNLNIKISTVGKLYDIKKSAASTTTNGSMTSGSSSLTYKILYSTSIDEGITFTADYEHYLFDFGAPF